MQKIVLVIAFTGALAALYTKPSGAAEPGTTDHFVSWLQGDFTNYQHTIEAPEDVALPVLYALTILNDDTFNEPVLVTTQAYLFTPEDIIRKQVITLTERRGGWHQAVYDVDPGLNKQQLTDRSNWQPLNGCRIEWSWEDGFYQGSRDPGRCYFILEDTGQRVGIAGNLKLDDFALRIEERLEFSGNVPLLLDDSQSINNYQRITYYNAEVQHRAGDQDGWVPAEPLEKIHDQGTRIGLAIAESGLELRYQILLRRERDVLHFEVYDLSRSRVVHEQVVAHGSEVIEFANDDLRLQLRPRL